ncbi:adult cuticle protein 1 [Anabrus simplex]|uniref:adult cuticle protein 1 n=1 Tax=Anabrus simplex TaxID=316456 RepID=UPI0035A2F539
MIKVALYFVLLVLAVASAQILVHPGIVGVVPAPGYVAATRGSVHTAPLPGNVPYASHHLNLAPAPGTI